MSRPVQAPVQAPVSKFPSAKLSPVAGAVSQMSKTVVQTADSVEKHVMDDDDMDYNPVVQTPKVSKEEAKAFLQRPKPRVG